MQPVHLVRYGLPALIFAVGLALVVIAPSDAATGAGIVLMGVAVLVLGANAFARLSIASQDDREAEERARSRGFSGDRR